MPYNNTPIEPGTAATGTANLPLARVKKIISADDDISACSANAAFAITIATELFIQHTVGQTYNVLRMEKKPRRQVAYKDVATAVSKHDNLEFLTDVIPKTTTYKQFRIKKAKQDAANGTGAPTTLTINGKQQRIMEQMTARHGQAADEDMEMDEADEDGEDGVDGDHEDGGVGYAGMAESPRSVRSVGTRFDPVRNGFEGGGRGRVDRDSKMEEE